MVKNTPKLIVGCWVVLFALQGYLTEAIDKSVKSKPIRTIKGNSQRLGFTLQVQRFKTQATLLSSWLHLLRGSYAGCIKEKEVGKDSCSVRIEQVFRQRGLSIPQALSTLSFRDEEKRLSRVYNEARRRRRILSNRIGEIGLDDSGDFQKEAAAENVIANEAKAKLTSLRMTKREAFVQIPNVLYSNVGTESQVLAEDPKVTGGANHLDVLGDAVLYNPKMCDRGQNLVFGHVASAVQSLISFGINFFVARNYIPIDVPLILRKSALERSGHFSKFRSDLFLVSSSSSEESYLTPTSEVEMSNLLGEGVASVQMPRRLVCVTPCFRDEETKSSMSKFLRRKVFRKVEIFEMCEPSYNDEILNRMLINVQNILHHLQLPHRIRILKKTETPFNAAISCDFEVFFPSLNRYIELASISSCGDFQSSRMRGNGSVTMYTLNGTGLAVERVIAALAEVHGTSWFDIFMKNLNKFYSQCD